jgi:hypothetical protein
MSQSHSEVGATPHGPNDSEVRQVTGDIARVSIAGEMKFFCSGVGTAPHIQSQNFYAQKYGADSHILAGVGS